ncbi:MAG: antibiotic biosynthesis monooxygenase [Kutzneria sp.]|nr:antibiotic biosynthesis monooxygenase [Kutzneria sp.]
MIISLNRITVTGCPPEEYERVYQRASDLMATQPGHVSQLFVRSETSPKVYFAVAEWESLEHYAALADVKELVDVFASVISLSDAPSPEDDKIEVEHHKADVVYEGVSEPVPVSSPEPRMVCLNKITLVDCEDREYEEVYRKGSDYMAAQPGHIRHKLVRSQLDPTVYFSVAEWQNIDFYRRLDELDELTEIFSRVNSKIDIENHECVVAYEHG